MYTLLGMIHQVGQYSHILHPGQHTDILSTQGGDHWTAPEVPSGLIAKLFSFPPKIVPAGAADFGSVWLQSAQSQAVGIWINTQGLTFETFLFIMK